MKPYILALDQGTTSSRAILFDGAGQPVQMSQKEIRQIYPQPGWVEHDAMEIWGSQSGVAREVLETAGVRPEQIAAIGITNQRETTVVWDKATGKPIANAIVWQCRRTAEICEDLKSRGWAERIRQKTGLVVDAYFSGTKIKWLLDNVSGARLRAKRGELLFGTIDTWLLWNLTRGKVHATDASNASRTMLFNINTLDWDDDILRELDIPRQMLPEVKDSSHIFGYTDASTFGGASIPIAGMAGDQHAALFGQNCLQPGTVKNTYGTGCFLLMQTGQQKIDSQSGLLTTIAWQLDGEAHYALEGSVFMGGATVQWLRDNLQLIGAAEDSEYYATKVADSRGVYFVPAFTGLGAPYWDMYARGTLVGLTRGSNKNHIIRAALEAIAFQSADVMRAMSRDAAVDIACLKVDGGATANNFLMQFQADILGIDVLRPQVTESTALGAAYLAGLAVGFWRSLDELAKLQTIDHVFKPTTDKDWQKLNYDGWLRAVERAKCWAT